METNARQKLYAHGQLFAQMKKGLLFIVSVITLFSCKKEKETEIQLPQTTKSRVVILNEGNFRSVNASIDLYYPSDHAFQEGVFSSNNGSRPLGDVAQSMNIVNGDYWVVVNNSNKIEILDPNTFQSIGKIEGFNSPRYIQPVSADKVYVSDLYEGKIYAVNPQSRVIEKQIYSGGWTEEMLVTDNKLFVCQVDSNQVYVIDALADTLVKKINTFKSPQSIGIDAEGFIWISCSGGYNEDLPALQRIDPLGLEIVKTLAHADISKSIGDISFDREKKKLFYLMEGLFQINITDTILASTPLIEKGGRNFYAMHVNPANNDIYLSDALDYQQKGVVYRYSNQGQLIHQFKAGLIPGFFYFVD